MITNVIENVEKDAKIDGSGCSCGFHPRRPCIFLVVAFALRNADGTRGARKRAQSPLVCRVEARRDPPDRSTTAQHARPNLTALSSPPSFVENEGGAGVPPAKHKFEALRFV